MEEAATEQVAALFARHGDAVYAYAQARVGSNLAADIVSDTFVVAWRRREVLPDPALPWLLATARRVVSTHIRSQRRQQSLVLRMESLSERQSQLAPEAGLDHELLHALDRLTERDRETLLLVAWFDLTHAEAAKVQGCSPGTFAVRLHRARRRVRELLDDRGERGRLAVVRPDQQETDSATGKDVS